MDRYMEEVKMEGRTIEYRPDGGGLDYHHSPLMAEIPVGDNYTHIHRSIEHLRSIGGGMLDPQRHLSHGITDLRRYDHSNHDPDHDLREKAVLRINEYKPSIHDLRAAQESMDLQHRGMEDHGPKGYSAPSTPLSDGVPEEKVFGSKADLQLHTQIHLREAKPYKCSQCTKAFANSSYLSQHTRIHLGIKPYRCEICQRKFTQLSHLQQHIRTHTGDKPYKCRHPGCQKAFSQLSNLQSHSRCHQTDKPYKCNSCYKCFSDEPSLLEHIPKHKESKHLKTHICQYCGKSYTQETYLSKHMQKHAERADKRPPIAGLGLAGLNRSLAGMPPNVPFEHPYWPKISPDSAAHLSEAMSQAHENANGNFQSQQQHDGPNGNEDQENEHLQNHHRNLFEHHRLNGNGNGSSELGEDLVVSGRQSSHLPPHLNGVQNHPAPSSTPVGSAYDNSLISKSAATANSAFTPINSMAPHLNSLSHHHQLAQRPYLYDTLSFQQNKQASQGLGGPGSNSFPNQLISLHQIRNYAHQPAGNLISSDHLIGHTLGIKDKQ